MTEIWELCWRWFWGDMTDAEFCAELREVMAACRAKHYTKVIAPPC